jgi:hypothetical protein
MEDWAFSMVCVEKVEGLDMLILVEIVCKVER